MIVIIKRSHGGYYKPARFLGSFKIRNKTFYSVAWDNLGDRFGIREKTFPAHRCKLVKKNGAWSRFINYINK